MGYQKLQQRTMSNNEIYNETTAELWNGIKFVE